MANRNEASQPPLVLIANDQEWSARSLESILGPNGYSVIRAYTGQQALDRARSAQPDVIILDAQMPDLHGFDVCRTLRNDPRFSVTTPIIITTSGPSGRSQRLEAYRCGAWEFLGQPLDGEALLLKLRTFVQSKLAMDSVRDESLLDASTGLYNMRGLTRRAREIGSEAVRRHDALACIVFTPENAESDGEWNDGPVRDSAAVGSLDGTSSDEEVDWVAERIGQIFLKAGRSSDAIGRLGPSEFAVIAPATGADGAVKLVKRLGDTIEAAPIPVRGGECRLRIRAGYCAVPDFAESPVDAVEILLRATTAVRDLRRDTSSDRIRSFEQVPYSTRN